jgi:hypothetical protein
MSRVGCLEGSPRRTLTRAALFLKRHVQSFGKAAESQRRATKGGVLLGQPGKFLATVRTVICHKERPLRSSRAFEADHIHTGHNARSVKTVQYVWIFQHSLPHPGITVDVACSAFGREALQE